MTREETKLAISEAVGAIACPLLVPLGFKRRGKSECLTRKHGEFQQSLDFLWHRPRYSDDRSDAHIEPHVRLGHLQLFHTQELIAREKNLVQGYPDAVFAGTIGLLGPEHSLVDWRPRGVEEINRAFRDIMEYVERWVMPYLDKIATLRDIVSGYEKGYCPLAVGEMWELRIAAAYYALGEPERALAALHSAVDGKLMFERKYRVPMEFLEAAVGSQVQEVKPI